MERNPNNLNHVMVMDKRTLLDWIIDINMDFAEKRFMTDELLTDDYLHDREQAYIDAKLSFLDNLNNFTDDALRELIFRGTTMKTIMVSVLKCNDIIKDVELIPALM